MNILTNAKFTSADGKIIQNSDSLSLIGAGKVFGQKFYGEQESFSFLIENNFTAEEYVVLKYSCQGLRRQLSYRKPFVFAVDKNGDEHPVICYDDISMDNRIHTVMVKAPEGSFSAVRIEFGIDRRHSARFNIYELLTCAENQLPMCCPADMESEAEGLEAIDIERYFNSRYNECINEIKIDGGRFFDSERVVLNKIPFRIKLNGNNVIAPPPPPQENDDIIMNFGVPAKRKLCRPVSRDSLTELTIDKKASELYFIMSMNGQRYQRWGFASDGTILGTYCGDVTMPLLVDDTEGFMAELVYEDGTRDEALPMNLTLGRHGVSGDMSVYAVPCGDKKLNKVVFHNRKLDTEFSIVAVSINPTDNPLYPEMLIPEVSEAVVHSVSKEKSMALDDNILSIRNHALLMKIDISKGLKLLDMKNDYTPELEMASCALLKLRGEDNSFVEELELISSNVNGDCAEITYKYDVLTFNIKAELSGENDVKWDLRVVNNGKENVRKAIIFPCMEKIKYRGNEDGWYFFPKYQNINSNETVFIYEESAPSFPMQFFDIYSPAQQGGLAVTTQERELVTRKYSLEKDENGIGFYVEYPEIYGEIPAGETFICSPAVLTAHEGDWKKSFEIYKKWLDSWYEPFRCQDKQWYRECFWLLAEIRDFFETIEFTQLPVWYDKDKKEFNFKKILEEQKEIAGCYPDILHLWGWTNEGEGDDYHQRWGNFGELDYEQYGGREAFKNALHEVRNDKDVQVSLYLHPTLLSSSYPQAEKFFPKHRVENDIGEHISLGDAYRMCHANEEWRDFVIEMYKKNYRDLQIPLMYVDEFSLRIENRCYGKEHGHAVPSSLLKTDRDFITALKSAMPDEVVLYGEYAPVDVNARYIDCNISYYIIDSVVDMIETAWRGNDGDDRLGRVFTDVYRFAFPKLVQLALPMAMRNLSWHPQKFLFFNGEAIYDSFWDNEESAGLDFTVHAFKLKKKYADCFTSDTPETMIETLSPAICANKFPAENRTLYTIYNRAYTTYRGKALRVPHKPGNIYYDAWNECIIDADICGEWAELPLEVHAQQMGCVVIEHR